MASDSLRLTFFILALVICGRSLIKVSGDLVFEDGYTVSTVVDGNPININPHSISPRSGQWNDIVVLDSVNSVFYTLSRPLSQGSVVKRFSGGLAGFSDGDVGSAMFDKPRSFAVDLKGNVYVADRRNLAVRKIGASGVTTIAGGLSKAAGHADGPGRNASFSHDFEITFLSDICALLVSDHGNKLIRQINLKSEDCSMSSQSGLSVGASWALGLVVSLLGFIGGFVARPYFISNTGRFQRNQIHGDMEPLLPSEAEESSVDALLRHQKRTC